MRARATGTFAADAGGYGELLAWAQHFGAVTALGVESTGSYAAGLVRYLRDAGLEVLEVNQPHAHTRRRRGKSDRSTPRWPPAPSSPPSAPPSPRTPAASVEAIRQLRVARDGAVKARSAALNTLTGLIVTAPEPLRQQLKTRKTTRGQATLCARFRPDGSRLDDPQQAAKAALRSIAGRIVDLDSEIAHLDRQPKQLIARTAPVTTARVGVSAGHAGTLLVTAGQNIDRLRSEAAFAALCGASPIPVSSGRTDRHRLNYRGDRRGQPRAAHDRRLPPALLRAQPRLRRAAHRRRQDQDRNHPLPQALHRPRDLPRLLADLQPAKVPRRPNPVVAITCGAGPIGRSLKTT